MPAALLVLMVLAALSIDSAQVFLAQRELGAAAQSAATDAVSALDDPAFYATGGVRIDPRRAAEVAAAAVAGQSLEGVALSGAPEVETLGRQVCVALGGRVHLIFGAALPGVPRAVAVHARATATAAGDTGPAVPRRAIC